MSTQPKPNAELPVANASLEQQVLALKEENMTMKAHVFQAQEQSRKVDARLDALEHQIRDMADSQH